MVCSLLPRTWIIGVSIRMVFSHLGSQAALIVLRSRAWLNPEGSIVLLGVLGSLVTNLMSLCLVLSFTDHFPEIRLHLK